MDRIDLYRIVVQLDRMHATLPANSSITLVLPRVYANTRTDVAASTQPSSPTSTTSPRETDASNRSTLTGVVVGNVAGGAMAVALLVTAPGIILSVIPPSHSRFTYGSSWSEMGGTSNTLFTLQERARIVRSDSMSTRRHNIENTRKIRLRPRGFAFVRRLR
ncbi:hypothetical protein BD779DRAFT_521882 [Infundibulicybe gibba]|nr:hypothetical protein BD779DRAFT_521882 [Infundibulicybe gibba]